MNLWIRLAFRNVTRNIRRTLLTIATIVIGTALVTLSLAWVQGIFGSITRDYTASAGHIRLVTNNFAARESLQPLYENVADAKPVLEALRQIPGVVDVQPRIVTGVSLTIGEEIGNDFGMVVGGTDEYYRKHLDGPGKLVKGSWLSGSKEVVLGRKLAEKLKAQVGGKVLLLGQTQNGSMSPISAKIVGVLGADAMLEQEAFMSLEDVRWLTDMPDGALELLVWTASDDKRIVAPVAVALKAVTDRFQLNLEPWYDRQPWASTLKVMDVMKAFIQILIVFVAALAIFNTMTMSVLERTTEIGVMRAMGLTRIGAVGLFVLEGAVIGLVGGVVGTLAGAVPAWYLQVHGYSLGQAVVDKVGNFPMRAVVYADLTTGIVVQSIVLGLVIAVVGAFLPALRAASVAPVTAMRARR